MGYLHIDNLYKNQDILMFKECYVLEKIHGTSCHISMFVQLDGTPKIEFFSGGVSYTEFLKLFDQEALKKTFMEMGRTSIVIFGEGYGGKCQGMRDTYGPNLKFVVFDVKIDDVWLDVPDMDEVATLFGLDVVPFAKIEATVAALDQYRDMHSAQAVKCGCGNDKLREGIVIRPLMELRKKNGDRIIAKHKSDAFSERVHTPKVRETDPEKLQKLSDAKAVADEWVTPMRLSHVLDKLQVAGMEDMRKVMTAMVEDVKREGEGEIEWSKDVERCICNHTVFLFKEHLKSVLIGQ